MTAKPKTTKVPKVPVAVKVARQAAKRANIVNLHEAAVRDAARIAYQQGRSDLAAEIAAAVPAKKEPGWFARWFGPETAEDRKYEQ